MRTTTSLIPSERDGHCCCADVEDNKDGGGFDRDDNEKGDKNKEDNDINKDSTVAAALENQRVRAMAEGGDRQCLMPSLSSTGPMKWKAGGKEEDDEGQRQQCHGPSKEGEVKPDLREK